MLLDMHVGARRVIVMNLDVRGVVTLVDTHLVSLMHLHVGRVVMFDHNVIRIAMIIAHGYPGADADFSKAHRGDQREYAKQRANS